MGNDPSEIIVAKNGLIRFAPAGTELPDLDDPRADVDAAFVETGYVTEDGAAFNSAIDLLEIPAWSAARAVRRDVNTRDFQIAFGLLQINPANLALSAGGGEATEPAPGVVQFSFPGDEDPLDEISLIVDWEDQGYMHRQIWDCGNVTEGLDTTLIRTAPSSLPVTYKALEPQTLDKPLYWLSDHPNWAPVS